MHGRSFGVSLNSCDYLGVNGTVWWAIFRLMGPQGQA